jgi:hypothetical protein
METDKYSSVSLPLIDNFLLIMNVRTGLPDLYQKVYPPGWQTSDQVILRCSLPLCRIILK